MKLLVLGGTLFVGRHLVETALARGHQVTLFNRGVQNAGLFPEVEQLRGDRDGALEALQGRTWDAVIDTCGYVPRIVEQSATLLADSVAHYTFISSISVYADFDQPGLNEASSVGVLDDPGGVAEITATTYGPLKALCEQAAEAALPGRVLTVRPGLIVGPYDPTDRFTYWPVRVAAGGPTLAPGDPDAQVQFIDVRDLAAWTLDMIERQATGVYNATGPADRLTMDSLLRNCRRVTESDADFIWVDEAYLTEHEVKPYTEMPLWLPSAWRGMSQADCSRAIAAGLTFRPLDTTITDTLSWFRAERDDGLRAGMTREREVELVEEISGF